jgi:hypothetical protein
MGQYSKSLCNKTDEELNEIFDSITTYTAEFIDDFLDELDIRRMLSNMKKRISEQDLITLINKLDSISTSKYLNFLKHELEIRRSEKTKSQQKYESPKNFNNEIKVPRVNPTFSLPPYSPTNNYFGFDN